MSNQLENFHLMQTFYPAICDRSLSDEIKVIKEKRKKNSKKYIYCTELFGVLAHLMVQPDM
jgi:hypothetical protein